MKCEFKKDGMLVVIAENDTEAFALTKWNRRNIELQMNDHSFSWQETGKALQQIIEARRDAFERFLQTDEGRATSIQEAPESPSQASPKMLA